jgi:MATE family multidrug resistance protein
VTGALRLRGPYDREIVALALPALGALAADPLVSLIDTAFVGRLGATALAALAVASAVFAVAFFIFNFVAYATTPMVARAVGAGDTPEAGRVVVTALLVGAIAGLGTLLILEVLAVPILTAMGAEGETLTGAVTYLRIRALAIPAVMVILAGHGAFRGFQDTATPLRVTLGLNVVNLILDPILIFGLGWGIAGAAWATVAAQWLGGLWFLWLLLVARRQALGVRLQLPGRAVTGEFLSAGRDLVVRTAALLGVMTLATAVAARVGTVEVAAHQVAVQVWVFLALITDALAIAAQAMVGRYLGRHDPARARAISDRLLVFALGIGMVFVAALAVLAPVIAGVFTDDPAVAAAIEQVFWFVVLMQPINALAFVWDGIVMGAEDFRYLAFAMVASAAAAAAVLLAVLPAGWGLAGVWWGLVVLMAGRILTQSWWYWRRRTPLTPVPVSGRADR